MGRFKTIVTIVLAFGLASCAQLHEDRSARFTGCRPISPDHPDRLVIEADVVAFVNTVGASGAARFEVQDCPTDGLLYDGATIILSASLARLPSPQRFFIIAHEFGHHRLGHEAQLGGVLANNLSQRSLPMPRGTAELAHRIEFEADAYAVRMMHAYGLDPEDAARLFDSLGAGEDNTTHPAFARRAQAIRQVIATLASR